ncbi:DUF4395 family protein [Thiomicrorhabdus sediminis]|uniref:DUF4395 domain-containing protein n=1 Tax=Thiomicrorhabdus sediminis TaxID=2580412 RepID=A0A4P9K4F8_9GAMM|nr:DUF4395 family protein [Thiomicrorhabdus sediminis]QCU89825.1 DUF4395 domain-containing protein [Thiomicrorhabdus sediminis]
MREIFKNLWFRDINEATPFINETAVRIRAGMLLLIPLYMGLTLFDVGFTSSWLVDGNTAVDSYDTDWDGNIIYQVEAIKRTYEYSLQTIVLFYALFEMIVSMFKTTSWLSPTIWISAFLAYNKPAVWKPLLPKRFAWTIGAILISVCLVFFNPEVFASWVNAIYGSTLLPETVNYMPFWIPMTLVWVCIGFMWLEAILGFCVGCQIHALLVKLRILDEPCEACGNIDWDEIARKHQERQQQQSSDDQKPA